MKDLNYQLKKLCQHNRDGSYATQRDRELALSLIADQLLELGYRRLKATSLKPKHVESLVARWCSEGLSTETVKNRMAVLGSLMSLFLRMRKTSPTEAAHDPHLH